MKKYHKYYAVGLAVLVLGLTACSAANQNNTDENNVNEERVYSLSVFAGETGDSYPMVKLDAVDQAAYPELADALELILKEREKECYAVSDVYETVTVRRADSKVVSLVFDGVFYQEKEPESCYIQTAVIDTKTGEQLTILDVTTDAEKMQEAICREAAAFSEDLTDGEEILEKEINEALNDVLNESWNVLPWTLDLQGVTVYLSSHAEALDQIRMITLSFAEYPDVIKAEYQVTAESWGSELSMGKHFYVDADGDGSLNDLIVLAEKNEYGDYEALNICVDGTCLRDEVYAFTAEPMLLHRKDGKNILFIEMLGLNDYRTISVYDISTGKAEKLGEAAGARVQSQDEESGAMLHQVLNNPEAFSLTTRTYLLGTYDGIRRYHLGENGLAEAESEYYEIVPSETIGFTVRCPLTAEVIAVDGSVRETTELLEGAPLLYYGTDNVSYADLMLPDGQIVRLSVTEGWPTLVNGIPVEEALEGVLFAG